MYTVAGDGPCNEELALRIQAGDKNAAERLLSQNEGYLTKLARAYTPWCELEDLKQEAALALLDAARRFDPAFGTKLLTYATPAIEAALSDYAARHAFPLSVPASRGSQLRAVAHLCAEAQDTSEAELTKAVCEKLMQRMEEVLTPRELNLVRSYLGIDQPDEVGMTFQELAIYLNYNGPSGAEKAYKAALRKLKRDLYGGAYGRWLSAQKAIRAAKAEAEQDAGHHATPQRTWWEEQALANRFACEVAALIRVYEVLSGA